MEIGAERTDDLGPEEGPERLARTAAENLAGEETEAHGVVAGLASGDPARCLRREVGAGTIPVEEVGDTGRGIEAGQADLMRQELRHQCQVFAWCNRQNSGQ